MTIPLTDLQRTFYFDGELLQLQDFVRDQRYVRDLVRFQNYYVFGPGVAFGLQISGKDVLLTVTVGMAFDLNRVPLFVVEDTTFDVSTVTLAPGTYPVGLAYSDSLMISPPSVLQANHLIIEKPVIQVPSKGDPAIVLGTVTIDANGKITGTDMGPNSGRQLSYITLPYQAAPPPRGARTPLRAPGSSSSSADNHSTEHFRGPLAVGDAEGTGRAMLSVSRNLDSAESGSTVARFSFSEVGARDSGVSVGLKKDDGSHALISARFAGVDVWELGSDGTARTLSDATAKSEVRPISGALDRLGALRPVSYVRSAEPGGRARLGLIAQEVAEVLPELVSPNAQGKLTVAYEELIPLLIQAIRELEARVAELEGRARTEGGAP